MRRTKPRKSSNSMSQSKCIQKLEVELARWMVSPGPTFISGDRLEHIWEDKDLRQFAVRLGIGDWEFIRQNLLKTISILVYIGWRDYSRVKGIFSHKNAAGQFDRVDSNLPYTNIDKLRDSTFLSNSLIANHFYQNQYAFVPIQIEEGEDREYPRDSRLPFIRESEEWRTGSYGTVTKVVVAKKMYKTSQGNAVDWEKTLARKRIEFVDDFRLEVNNLRRLKQSRLRHDRIMMYSCSLLHGNECNIFFDWADWHLFDLLNENCDKATCFDISPVNLLRESSNLAEALMFLHDQLGDIFCCHMDLKPDNILIIKHKDAPVGQWMITDFGISTFKETSGRSNDGLLSVRELEVNIANKTTLATRTVPKRAPGPFQPPEVELSPGAAQFGRKSDVWSFGCVLAMVVAFALGGRQLVEELGEARAADSDLTDYFYQVCFMVAEVKPSISKWLDGLSGRFPTGIIWIPRCSELIKSTLRIRQEQRPHSRYVTRILKEICSSISQRPRWGTVNESRHPLPSEHGNMESVRAFSVPNTSLALEKAQSISSASQFAPSSRTNTDDVGSENDSRTSDPHHAGLLPARTGSDQSQSSLHEEGPLDFSPSNRFGSHSRPSSLSPYGNSQCYESGIIRDYDGPLDAPTPLPPESRSGRTESNESLPRVQNLVHRATTLSLGDKADCSIRASSKFELPKGSLLQSSISASGDRVVFLSKKAAYVYSLEGLHSDASRTPRAEIEGSWHRASLAGNFVALRGEASKVAFHCLNSTPPSTISLEGKPTRMNRLSEVTVSVLGDLVLRIDNTLHLRLLATGKWIEKRISRGLENEHLRVIAFGPSGEWLFAWSNGPGPNHWHVWHVDDDSQEPLYCGLEKPSKFFEKVEPFLVPSFTEPVTFTYEKGQERALINYRGNIRSAFFKDVIAGAMTPSTDVLVLLRKSNKYYALDMVEFEKERIGGGERETFYTFGRHRELWTSKESKLKVQKIRGVNAARPSIAVKQDGGDSSLEITIANTDGHVELINVHW